MNATLSNYLREWIVLSETFSMRPEMVLCMEASDSRRPASKLLPSLKCCGCDCITSTTCNRKRQKERNRGRERE